MAESVNFVVLGVQETAAKLGKRGTSSDLTMYDRKSAGIIRTWVVPTGFPGRIQPLLEAINMAEHVIFHAGALDRFTGEQIVALDALGRESGIISCTCDVDEARLRGMIRGTSLEGYSWVPEDQIAHAADAARSAPAGGPAAVEADHCFDVRGVGTVVLGRVVRGSIRQYDSLKAYPGGTDVMVKSIQMHDEPVREASSPARVGMAIKGARPEEIQRGDMICTEGAVSVSDEIELDLEKSPFYKGDLSEDQGCLVNLGLQTRAARCTSVSPARFRFERPVMFGMGQTAVVLKPESDTTRILGSGRVA